MIQSYDVIPYEICRDFSMVDGHARIRIEQFFNGEANQWSKVHKEDWPTRVKNFPMDAYCQNMGEYAINSFVSGPVKGPQEYDRFGTYMNAHPKESDGKTDVPGYQIDVKTSAMRADNKGFLEYTLIVPPGDKQPQYGEVTDKPENVFVLGLVKKGDLDTKKRRMVVYLIGWAWNHELDIMMGYGPFKNKFTKIARDIHPMTEFPYDSHWVKTYAPKEIR